MKIISYGQKVRSLKLPAQIDVRIISNPYQRNDLRPLDGRHPRVQQFVKSDPAFEVILRDARALARKFDPVAFYCLGGKHRSVACAELLADVMRSEGVEVEIEHMELAQAT